MGDIVVYDHLGQNPQRFWVPGRELRFWLRFWRQQGHFAWSLNQWRRMGERPFVTPKKPLNRRAQMVKLADSASRISFVKRDR